MKKLLSWYIQIKKVFFLTIAGFLLLTLSSFNSQEHKLLGDIGMSRVIIPASIRFPAYMDWKNMTQYSDYATQWLAAKRLAVGYNSNDASQYSSFSTCQDNCYSSAIFKQLPGNKNIFIEQGFPSAVFNIATYLGNTKVSFSFGDLVALYGDFRRTVFFDNDACYLTNQDNVDINFNSVLNRNYCPPKITTEEYLEDIAFGLWPPFGNAGNSIYQSVPENAFTDAAWWGDEMMRLANVNETHFSNVAVAWYTGMHRLALLYVNRAIDNPIYWNQAMHYEASALHCLTDLFAFGHVVTNREQSSYGTMSNDGLLNAQPNLWMENVIRMGGGVRRIANEDNYPGKVSLSSDLPILSDVQSVKNDFMGSYFGKVPGFTWGFWAMQEHDYHDYFNNNGATVRNFNGDRFHINGDKHLHEATVNDRRVIEDAVTASIQSLLDSYDMIKRNRMSINDIAAAGSSYFRALKYIPVFIESDPDNYFWGMWSSYADDVRVLTGVANPPIPENCKIPYLSGELPAISKWPAVQPAACAVFPDRIIPTVRIGNQVWMQQNLDVATFRDGTPIPEVEDSAQWVAMVATKTPAWCRHPGEGDVYGKLYNWWAVNSQDHGGLAPAGWHIPSDDEWTALTDPLGGYDSPATGGALKEAGTTHWLEPNTAATNSTGFTALPGGWRYNYGQFQNLGKTAIWWTSTIQQPQGYNQWTRNLTWLYGYVGRNNALTKGVAASVRCIKD